MGVNLSPKEIVNLIRLVFNPGPADKGLCFLIDVPDESVPDNPEWMERRHLTLEWKNMLNNELTELGLKSLNIVYYKNVGKQNADLPGHGYYFDSDVSKLNAGLLEKSGQHVNFDEVFTTHQMIIAPTEFSATAPLKLKAKRFGFSAATMPGFTKEMIPAMRLDFNEVNSKVSKLKEVLDKAESAKVTFSVREKLFNMNFDLRYRTATASSGILHDRGIAGNLPSGEAYIVPYEGEKGEPSETAGLLPVQFGDEVVIYKVDANRAVEVVSRGKVAAAEASKIRDERAYANIAELGFGVLAGFGIKPIGKLLLDEKLGFHIAFGRSDHFGGAVGAADFTHPSKVEHTDHVYVPSLQDQIIVEAIVLRYKDDEMEIMRQNRYVL